MAETFYMPVRVVEGEGCVVQNAELLAPLGKKALIVTGKSSARNGSLADVQAALKANGQ